MVDGSRINENVREYLADVIKEISKRLRNRKKSKGKRNGDKQWTREELKGMEKYGSGIERQSVSNRARFTFLALEEGLLRGPNSSWKNDEQFDL